MKKMITTILLSLTLLTTFSSLLVSTNFTTENVAFAETKAPVDSPSQAKSSIEDLTNLQFNVNKVLSTDNQAGNNDQSYFAGNKNPIIDFILRVMNFALTVMGSLAIIIFIIAGFMLMFAQGNQQKIDEAKEIIQYAFIGLAIAFLSYIITIFIQSIFITPETATTAKALIETLA